jgi:hypothetical protein
LPSGGFWHGMWTDDGVNTMTLIALANTGALVARAVRVEQGNIKGLSMAISAAKESGSSRCVIPILYSAGEGPLHWLGIVLNSSESTMTATYIDPEGLDPVPEVALALRNAGVNDVSVANMPTQTCSDNCGEVLIFGFANSLGANIGSVANAASILSDMLASHLSSSPNEGSAAGTNLPQVVEVGPSETVLRLDPVKGMSRAFTNAVRQGRETASELLIKIEELLYVVLDAPQGAREVLFTNMLLGMADDLNNKEALTPFFTGGGPNGDPDNGGGSSGGGEKENGADNSFSALLGMNSSNKSSLVGITDDTDSITS